MIIIYMKYTIKIYNIFRWKPFPTQIHIKYINYYNNKWKVLKTFLNNNEWNFSHIKLYGNYYYLWYYKRKIFVKFK